jgi:hypothetical protein
VASASINSPRWVARIAFVNPASNLRALPGEPDFLFVQHRNRALHEFIDALVGALLDVLLNQIFKIGTKANFHDDILLLGWLPVIRGADDVGETPSGEPAGRRRYEIFAVIFFRYGHACRMRS